MGQLGPSGITFVIGGFSSTLLLFFWLMFVYCSSDDSNQAFQEILTVDATRKTQTEALGWSGHVLCSLRAAVMPESRRMYFEGIGLLLVFCMSSVSFRRFVDIDEHVFRTDEVDEGACVVV